MIGINIIEMRGTLTAFGKDRETYMATMSGTLSPIILSHHLNQIIVKKSPDGTLLILSNYLMINSC